MFIYIKKKEAKQNKQIKQSFYQTRRVNYYSETAATTTIAYTLCFILAKIKDNMKTYAI